MPLGVSSIERLLCPSIYIFFEHRKKYSTARPSADKGNVHSNRHLDRFHVRTIGLMMMPVMRCREKPVDTKEACQTFAEVIERLHIVVGSIYDRISVVEINIR